MSAPLPYSDIIALEIVDEALDNYLHSADKQVVFERIRTKLIGELASGSLASLHNVCGACRRCGDLQPGAAKPIWNLADPDVVFIVDSPSLPKGSMDYFVADLKEAGFSSKDIALTYLNRCMPKSYRPYTDNEIENCKSYLFSEIQLWRPKLIVPVGGTVCSSILGEGLKMGDIRGRLHWIGAWAVLPVMSPAYVSKAGGNAVANFKSDLKLGYEFVYGRSSIDFAE